MAASFACFEFEYGSIVSHVCDSDERGIITARMDIDGRHKYRVQWSVGLVSWHQPEEIEVVIPPRPLTRPA